MSRLRYRRPKAPAVILVVLLSMVLGAVPGAFRPAGASAQGVICGGIYFPNATYCGTTGGVGVTCGGIYYPNLTACPSGVNDVSCPDGSLVAVGQSCPQLTYTCPDGSVISAGQSCPTPAATQYCNGAYVSLGSCGGGFSVTYAAGWNLVGGPTGTVLTGTAGSIYTLTPSSGAYVALPSNTPLQGGVGYWAYFPGPATVTLPQTVTTSTTAPLPAGPFVLIGNPSDAMATVSGSGAVVLTYDPASGMYAQTNQLLPGQGAWAASSVGGQLSIVSLGGSFGPAGGPPAPPPPLPPSLP